MKIRLKKIGGYLMKVRLVFVFLLFASFLNPGVKNPDKPLKGDWDFQLKKIWTVDRVGENVFGGVLDVTIAENGTVYVRDNKIQLSYIFDKDGNYKKSFGPKGEGPGEVKRFFRYYILNDNLIIGDIDKLSYFTMDGQFIRSVRNNAFAGLPSYFFNENEFLTVTHNVFNPQEKDKKGKIVLVNLQSGERKILTEFSIFKKMAVETGQGTFVIVDPIFTPMLIYGNDDERIYYGMNDAYEITVLNFKGEKINDFSVDRPAKTVSKKDKTDRFAGRKFKSPTEAVDQFIKNLPDQLTYFTRIEKHKTFIYVFSSQINLKNKKQIDIFSLEGKYLYRGFLDVGGELEIFDAQYTNPVIEDDYLYITEENQEGTILFSKYKITHPKL
jgi:hypothetical protein